jgi:hypothetical protein
MKIERVWLKARKDLYTNKITLKEYKELCWKYGEELESKGWKVVPIEGGCISPDNSTIYCYFRDEHIGELIKFIPNKEKEFQIICNDFVKNDFIYENEILKLFSDK